MKTKKKDDPRKRPEHAPRPIDQWIAGLMEQIETGPLNNFTTTSFDTAKLRNDELQRQLYEEVFILGKAEDVEEYVKTLPRNGKAIIMGGIWRDRGAALFKEGKLDDAIESWKQSMRYSLSEPQGSTLPHPTAFVQAMADTGLDEYDDLIACANNIAQSFIKKERLPEALDWLNECMCLHRSSGTAKQPSFLPWHGVLYPYEEFNILYLKMMMRWENVLWKLGNTSAAYAAIYEAMTHRAIVFRNSDVLKADIRGSARKYMDMRHPDPRNIEEIRIINPDLQIKGAWRKL
ncbi:hypothetical protein FRC04_002470 [Tulasnella sp. 424]|nr:hypothetical protein FRC04_002470 [Tulasnella sp. 424]KAG8967577.1 hypothetical protein FRC05_002010 [Tulasnella sp. 425]